MKSLIKVGYRCNQACLFCHREDLGGIEAGRGEVEAKIERAARLGHSMVVFSGGEATLRPELLEWSAQVAALGMELGLVTNGTLLDRDLVERLVRSRLRYVQLSLHGGTAAVHDALAGAETFDRALSGLRALSGRGLELWVNCVVTRQNVGHLRTVLAALAPFPDVAVKFSMVEPRGGAARAFEVLVPSVSDVAAAVRDVLDAALRDGRRAAHDGIPFCLLPGHEGRRGDLRDHGYWTMSEVGEPDLAPVDERNTLKPPRCRPCALRGRCPGLFTGYHERLGDEELRPVLDRPRSNSFHYVYEGRVPWPAAARCPVVPLGVAPWDRARHLFVHNGDRVAHFRTETRDFCDEDVGDVKFRAGQIYLDVSRRPTLEDFARELVKLRRSDECSGCPEAGECTGLYAPHWENLFLRDDARVLEILRSLEGDVLDVGCGESPYAEALARSAEASRIRYTGVEPDAARAARMRERWPWARLRVERAEDLRVGEERYDHVVVLRSWNHLAEPATVMVRLCAALRPGGTLTLVDNEAFALARTRAQATGAERSAARFEHWRNDGAAEAHALLERAGLLEALRLVERRDVGPATSNQWLLRYEALPAAAHGAPVR